MKRALKLSLAISLALGAGNALAIGLGQIQVKSRLNQPLDAEIPVIVDRRGEAESLVIKLASAEEFSRVGIDRSQLGIPLAFALGQGARGETVIKVTSTEAVRAPFLDFLIEANWSNGRVLREYTVLLDPPLSTPSSAASAIAAEPAARPATARPAEPAVVAEPTPRAADPKPAAVVRNEPAAAPPAAKPATAAVSEPASKPAASASLPPSVAASNGSHYGPVAAGETLWEIAQATLPEDGVSANQLMLALLKANPDAFARNNINQLKRGAILRIPSGEEIRAVGSMRAAAAQVQTQIAEWRGASQRPTLLAGSAPATSSSTESGTATSAAPRDDRLALVPPEMGKDGLASTGQVGSSAGTPGGNATAAELARANESLATRTQEAGELRTRVKDLESLQSKNDRLISLKDSEIADLQRKLAALQAQPVASASSAAAALVPAAESSSSAAVSSAASVSSTAAVVAKDDIWGSSASSSSSSSAVAAMGDGAAPLPAVGETSSQAAVAAASSSATGAEAAASSASSSADGVAAVVPPTATPPAADTTTRPVETTPVVKPVVAPVVVDEQPWYLDPRVLGGAGVIALLLGLLAWRSRRKPVAVISKPSLADQFAGMGAAATIPVIAETSSGIIVNDEETQLADQIAFRPHDLGARLELLSIYYADNRVDEFRAGALQMQPFVTDPREPEWVQVRAMGEDLFPNDPLFSSVPVETVAVAAPVVVADIHRPSEPADDELRWADLDEVVEPVRSVIAPAVIAPVVVAAIDEERYAPVRVVEPTPSTLQVDALDDEDLFDLDHEAGHDKGLELTLDDDFDDEPALAPVVAATPTPAATGRPLTEFVADPKKDEAFGFDLPPLDFDMEFSKPATPAAAASAPVSLSDDVLDVDVDDDFYVSEDALGTKLDLARAYADMGDPEGARAMLEEVLAEGDDLQKDQARKLMAELG